MEEMEFDEKGDPVDWADLTVEETRKFDGLKKYYIIFWDKTETDASIAAWADLQNECKRLKDFKWYK
jgi:hypothetical protein